MVKVERVRYKALDVRVLVVALEGGEGDWAAYIGAVKGENHEYEWRDVADSGSKLPRNVAEVLFPDFKDLEWRE